MAPPHVCIIGAGVSGLRCASVLLSRDFEVTIIEARDRLGGRIHQTNEMGVQEIDMGANWVHSTGYNPIVELAKKNGTPLHRWKDTAIIVNGDGQILPSNEGNKSLLHIWDILEQANVHSTGQSKEISETASLYDFFKDACTKAVKSNEMTEEESALVLDMSHTWGSYVGDAIERQSLKFFFLEDCIEGDDCFIPTSYKKIVEDISAIPVQKAQIQYKKIMQSVEYKDDKVCVVTTDGHKQYFDDVVVTVPHGYMRKHKESIPQLTPRLISAMDSISYGRLEKTLIEFPFSFWDKNAESPVSFIHWLTPSYAPKHNSSKWRLECVSFNAFPAPLNRNILLFYTFGDCSSYIADSIHQLTPEARKEFIVEFFEPYYSRLPNYNAETCAPIRCLATTWSKDEFSGGGSYSNFQIGMKDAAKDVETIRYGMPDKHIYFAGEHTAPFDGLGTVAGSYTSGEKVAQRIIDSKK